MHGITDLDSRGNEETSKAPAFTDATAAATEEAAPTAAEPVSTLLMQVKL